MCEPDECGYGLPPWKWLFGAFGNCQVGAAQV